MARLAFIFRGIKRCHLYNSQSLTKPLFINRFHESHTYSILHHLIYLNYSFYTLFFFKKKSSLVQIFSIHLLYPRNRNESSLWKHKKKFFLFLPLYCLWSRLCKPFLSNRSTLRKKKRKNTGLVKQIVKLHFILFNFKWLLYKKKERDFFFMEFTAFSLD